jgi:catalase-peroxidase
MPKDVRYLARVFKPSRFSLAISSRLLPHFHISGGLQDDAKHKFVTDFVSAWVKVMNGDRFDLT